MSGSPEYKRARQQGSTVWVGGHPHSSVSSVSTLQGGIPAKAHNGDYRFRVGEARAPMVEVR